MAKFDLAEIIDDALVSFNLKKTNFFGVDIGLSAIKVCELSYNSSDESFTIEKYASVPLPEGALIEDEVHNAEEVINAITKAKEKAGISSKEVVFGIFGRDTVTKRLQVAGDTESEIEQNVTWEAEQYLPFNVEESKISHFVIGENDAGTVDVVIAAAKTDIIDSYKDIFEEAGLKVKVLDMSMIAIINVFEHIFEDKLINLDTSCLFLDIGAQKTEFIIYRDMVPVYTKEIPIGGLIVTEEIQRNLGLNYFEAEDLKINGDGGGNTTDEIKDIIDSVIQSFYTEIKSTYDFYVNTSSDDSVLNCFITGGGSQLLGIVEGISDVLDVNCEYLDPFQRIHINSDNIDKEAVEDIRWRGIQSIGLAMRNFDD